MSAERRDDDVQMPAPQASDIVLRHILVAAAMALEEHLAYAPSDTYAYDLRDAIAYYLSPFREKFVWPEISRHSAELTKLQRDSRAEIEAAEASLQQEVPWDHVPAQLDDDVVGFWPTVDAAAEPPTDVVPFRPRGR